MDRRGQEPIRESLQEYGRGAAGGLLFSLPLLYTMEVWWAGFLLDSSRLLICFVTTFLLLLAYNRFSGLHPGVRFWDVVIDSVEEFGIGIVLAALVLFLLGRIAPGMPREEILGKIIIESMLVSIGVSVGTAQLGMSQSKGDDAEEDSGEEAEGERQPKSLAGGEGEQAGERVGLRARRDVSRPHLGKQAALSLCGAVLFAANVAPTEEIVVIATESPPWRLLALVVLSLAMGALILYFSEFHQSRHIYPPAGWVLGTLEVAFAYGIALFASAMILWFFQRFEGVSLATGVAEVVVLGFASNLGAFGRKVIDRMNQHRKAKNWLEWTMFSLGLLLVAALVLYLAYDIWTAPSGPARIEVTLGEGTAIGDAYRVPVELRNTGYETAEQVHLEVVLHRGEQTEEAQFVIQFLPRGAKRHGAVTFTTDPNLADRLEARVLGYQKP